MQYIISNKFTTRNVLAYRAVITRDKQSSLSVPIDTTL